MIKNSKLWSKNITIKCVLGIIILSLILSTIGSYFVHNTEKYVAIVNGEKISLYEFKRMYMIERKKQQQMLGEKFLEIHNDKKFIQETYHYVLLQLINNLLLEQYAKKLGLTIADEEIKKIILHASIFQEKNIFSKKKYFDYLDSIELRNNEYINIIKKRFITEKLINIIHETNFMLKHEKKNIIKLFSEERMIQKAIIEVEPMIKKQIVTHQEAKDYFFQHRDLFYTPEKFKISYIQMNINDLKTECSQKEIQKWYHDHIQDYYTEEKKEYSIIQTHTKEEASLILSKLKQSANFSEMAKKNSIDPLSSTHGGNIGWITTDAIPDVIKETNLNKKNQISDVVPFNNTFLIIKLNDTVKSQKKKLPEVYDIIKKNITSVKSLKKYNILKNKINDFIKKHPNQYNLLIKEINAKPIETDWFTINSIPKLFDSFIFKKILSDKRLLEKDNQLKFHSDIIEFNNDTLFIISVKNHQKKEKQPFDIVKNNIILKIKTLKAFKQAKEQAEKIILQLNKGNADYFKQLHLFFNPSEIISRHDQNFITPLVFSLPHPTVNKKIYTTFQDENNNIVILLFSKIHYKNFSKEEEKLITKYLEENNTETMFHAILKHLYEESNVTYETIEGI